VGVWKVSGYFHCGQQNTLVICAYNRAMVICARCEENVDVLHSRNIYIFVAITRTKVTQQCCQITIFSV